MCDVQHVSVSNTFDILRVDILVSVSNSMSMWFIGRANRRGISKDQGLVGVAWWWMYSRYFHLCRDLTLHIRIFTISIWAHSNTLPHLHCMLFVWVNHTLPIFNIAVQVKTSFSIFLLFYSKEIIITCFWYITMLTNSNEPHDTIDAPSVVFLCLWGLLAWN